MTLGLTRWRDALPTNLGPALSNQGLGTGLTGASGRLGPLVSRPVSNGAFTMAPSTPCRIASKTLWDCETDLCLLRMDVHVYFVRRNL